MPEPKRKFGYFCLPLLRGTDFIGLVDAKADRTAGLLRVERFHWDPAAGPAGRRKEEVKAALERFAVFNGCRGLRGLSRL